MARRLIAIVTDEIHGPEPVDEICADADGDGVDVRVVAPAVEATPLRHTLGDVDEPKRQAERRLEAALRVLRERGIPVRGEVGDPDPIQAAEDALLEEPADEVLIFEHAEGELKWFETGLFERARERLEPPLRLVVLESADGTSDHIVDREEAEAGTAEVAAREEVGLVYLPGLSWRQLAGMAIATVGTIVAWVLAGAIAAGPGQLIGREGAAFLIALGLTLINLAHVVGLFLMETVRYRGGFARFFRTLSLVLTPIGVLVNVLLLVID